MFAIIVLLPAVMNAPTTTLTVVSGCTHSDRRIQRFLSRNSPSFSRIQFFGCHRRFVRKFFCLPLHACVRVQFIRQSAIRISCHFISRSDTDAKSVTNSLKVFCHLIFRAKTFNLINEMSNDLCFAREQERKKERNGSQTPYTIPFLMILFFCTLKPKRQRNDFYVHFDRIFLYAYGSNCGSSVFFY